MLGNWISWIAWHGEWRVRQCPQSRQQTGLSSNNSVPVSNKLECTLFHERVSGRAWFHSHLMLCLGFLRQEEAWCPQDLAGCLEAAGGWLFHGATLCRWTLRTWAVPSQGGVCSLKGQWRCLNPCWTWECICYDGFAEHCFTDFLEKKMYLYRSCSF